jgi:proteasome accessory factor B
VGGHGPDVVVLEPPELADSVRRGWLAAARAHAEPPVPAAPREPAPAEVEGAVR